VDLASAKREQEEKLAQNKVRHADGATRISGTHERENKCEGLTKEKTRALSASEKKN
jgi:hypothetical protein